MKYRTFEEKLKQGSCLKTISRNHYRGTETWLTYLRASCVDNLNLNIISGIKQVGSSFYLNDNSCILMLLQLYYLELDCSIPLLSFCFLLRYKDLEHQNVSLQKGENDMKENLNRLEKENNDLVSRFEQYLIWSNYLVAFVLHFVCLPCLMLSFHVIKAYAGALLRFYSLIVVFVGIPIFNVFLWRLIKY